MPMVNDGSRDIALLRNPTTGAFDSFNWDSTNNPIFDDSDSHSVISCLLETEYWANPVRRSRLPSIKLDRTSTQTDLTSACEDALAYAIKVREIKSATVSVNKKAPGSYGISISYKNRDGHQLNVRLPIGS